MLTALEEKRIRDLITETVTMLCQNSLKFRSKFTVEGLLGITVDDKHVFLINIHEIVTARPSIVSEQIVSHDTVEGNDITILPESHVVADFPQTLKTRPAKTLSLLKSGHCDPRSASNNILTYDQLDEEIAHTSSQQAIQSGRLLPAGEKLLETSSSLSSVTGGGELMPSTSTEGCELEDHDVVTVKEELTSDSETNASDSRLDCSSQELLMECNSVWPDKLDTYIKV